VPVDAGLRGIESSAPTPSSDGTEIVLQAQFWIVPESYATRVT
jgi:hypothetical protein